MGRRIRTVLKILVGVVLFGAVLAFFGYRLLTRSLPEIEGRLALEILKQPVDVYRDAWGVPHVLARNARDLYRAVGYVTAQDRLWQMDFNRRVASGRLAEIFGPSMLESDQYMRLWGLRRIAERILPALSEESRAALEAYAEGVNAYIEQNRQRLPLEFSVLGYKPEPWEPLDTVAIGRFMAWRLSFSWYTDLMLFQLVQTLGPAKAREVFPDFPKQGPFIIPKDAPHFWTATHWFRRAGLELRRFLGLHTGQLGSNSWAVSGSRTACGQPMLANDPHLQLTAPSVWYEMHCSDGAVNAAGVVLPGTPVLLIGHTEDMAWGLTNGMLDDVDFYLERVDPENPDRYWDGKAWVPFEIVEEEIPVKGGPPVPFRVRLTRNGPVVSEVHPVAKSLERVVSMRWTGFEASDELRTPLRLLRARTWDDFREAVRSFRVPAQNFVFASRTGDIGYYLGGAIPIRRNTTGILPHEGWTPVGQWDRWVPFEEQPHVLNPAEGFVVTANNPIVDERYPYYLTNLWEPPGRAARIRAFLAERDSLTLADFRHLQTDVVSPLARELLPVLLEAVRAELDSTANPRLQTLYDLLKTWDGREDEQSVAASIFHAFFIKVTEHTLKDEMGEELYQQYIRLGSVPVRVMTRLLKQGRSAWFDDVTTPESETRSRIVTRSLLAGGRLLRERFGDNIADWKWGEVHALTMRHPLGRQKALGLVFNLGPFPRGGSKTTVNNGEYRFYRPFEPMLGPSTRQLVDFCDVDAARSVITTGQAGHPLSRHYKDQTPLWLKGGDHPMPLDWTEVVRAARQHLELVPNHR